MKKSVKFTAILMALFLALSVFASLAATTTVAADTTTQTAKAAAITPTAEASTAAAMATPTIVTATATTTTMGASNPNPTVSQTVTFTVNLKSGSTGLSKPVTIWHSWPGGDHTVDGTFNTVNGVYTFTQSFGSSGQRVYHAEFAGDSIYGASLGTVTVNVGMTATTTTITASNPNPAVSQTVTFTVNLKSGTTGLSKSVKIWHIVFIGDMILRYEDGTHNTVNGVYTFTQAFGSTGQRIYHAEFAGDSMYKASANIVTVNVKAPTTTTITASKTDLRLNEPVTFTVNLKSGTTPLNKPVKIWYTLNDVRTDTGTFNTLNGVYTFTQSYGLTGQRVFYAEFAGDSMYKASAGTVTVNVIY